MENEREKEIKTALKNVGITLEKLKKNEFKLLFFVADSKGAPIGSLTYTYELAYALKELGYDVRMLYAENEFVGVEGWLGEKYAKLPHYNSTTDTIDIAPCDFLFIPELFSNVMVKTRDLPCKKIAILENFNYMTDLIPYGASWETLGIADCITTSDSLSERLHELFPRINTYVIHPVIDDMFKQGEQRGTKKLVINIISNDENVAKRIVKPFKWRYPVYNFVTFRLITGRPRTELPQFFEDSFATVWVDTDTNFGITALEAMAKGNIVIGKIPENEPEWMLSSENQLRDNGVWFYKLRELPKILADVIQTTLYDNIPENIYKEMADTVAQYTSETRAKEIKQVVVDSIISKRTSELEVFEKGLKNNLKEVKESKE